MTSKHRKILSTSDIIKQIQIKTPRYYCTPIRTAKEQNAADTKR
jgi:hypothetical protein